MTQLSIQSSDEDENWLFERIVRRLQIDYGHSEDVSIQLVNSYYRKFTDPAFCAQHNIRVQHTEFFLREESLVMADRIQYHEALGNLPDEGQLTEWQRKHR